MSKRSLKVIPGNTLGKWSVGLIVVMPILFVLGSFFARSIYELVSAGTTILADIASRPVLALTMLAGMGAGISGFITGLLAIIKQKEGAISVYLSTLIGGLLILYLAAEIIFPH